jgi:hypothetical protein
MLDQIHRHELAWRFAEWRNKRTAASALPAWVIVAQLKRMTHTTGWNRPGHELY